MDVSTYTAVGAVGLLPDARWGLAVTASKCQSGSSSQPPLNRGPTMQFTATLPVIGMDIAKVFQLHVVDAQTGEGHPAQAPA